MVLKTFNFLPVCLNNSKMAYVSAEVVRVRCFLQVCRTKQKCVFMAVTYDESLKLFFFLLNICLVISMKTIRGKEASDQTNQPVSKQ